MKSYHQLLIAAVIILITMVFIVPVYGSTETSSPTLSWTAILPPLIAILAALLLREVFLSLLLGIALGSYLLSSGSLIHAFTHILTVHLWSALANRSHAAIILFTMFLGGMVGVFAQAGGTQGIVQAFSKLAKGRRGGMMLTWLLGIIIFFDDYANSLMVGQTMRPYTDQLRISRAKLAYIVDSTAAPVASIALISTWIGFEVGLLRDAVAPFPDLGDAYMLFIQAIPYHFYSLFALVLVFAVAKWGRDIGPMHHAEKQALAGNDPSVVEKARRKPAHLKKTARGAVWIAAIPILMVIIVTFLGLYLSGRTATAKNARLFEIFGQADSSAVLLVSSFLGLLMAGLLSALIARMKVNDISNAVMDGFRSMLPAIVILLLAWSLGDVCERLGTAQVVIKFASGFLSPSFVPTIVFIAAALIAFSTGTSWGTMAILVPIALPLAHSLALEQQLPSAIAHSILLGSVGAVLAGATFGDHCSPISDTTILSSLASGCNHIAHVRTQIPYALLGAGLAVILGYLPAGFGVPPWISLAFGFAVVFFLPGLFKKTE